MLKETMNKKQTPSKSSFLRFTGKPDTTPFGRGGRDAPSAGKEKSMKKSLFAGRTERPLCQGTPLGRPFSRRKERKKPLRARLSHWSRRRLARPRETLLLFGLPPILGDLLYLVHQAKTTPPETYALLERIMPVMVENLAAAVTVLFCGLLCADLAIRK